MPDARAAMGPRSAFLPTIARFVPPWYPRDRLRIKSNQDREPQRRRCDDALEQQHLWSRDESCRGCTDAQLCVCWSCCSTSALSIEPCSILPKQKIRDILILYSKRPPIM